MSIYKWADMVYNRSISFVKGVFGVVYLALNEVLQSRGKDAVWLAKELHIPAARAQQLADGGAQAVSLDMIERLCDLLDCEVGDLLKKR